VAGFNGWLSWHGRFGLGDIPPGPMLGPLKRGPPIPGLGMGNRGGPSLMPGVLGPPGLGMGNFCDLSLGVPDRAIRCWRSLPCGLGTLKLSPATLPGVLGVFGPVYFGGRSFMLEGVAGPPSGVLGPACFESGCGVVALGTLKTEK
jgi:hypothetical protein